MEDSSSTTMSLDSSTSVVGVAPPGKRAAADSVPMDVEGLAVPGSDKKRKWDDDHNDCDWLQFTYENLTSINLFPKIIRGKLRVEKLMDSKQIEKDVGLLDSFADLLSSKEKLGSKHDPVEQLRLIELAKKILREWEAIEITIPPPQLHSLSSFCMASIDYPHAVPSAWLFERRWRDMAYEEVLNLRKKYSYLLDIAFRDSRKSGLSRSIVLSRKKLLMFVASSKEDIDYMPVEKCYKAVMRIKQLCIVKKPPLLGPVSASAPANSTDKIQTPNWRDEIYEQIEACRKIYSFKLDELLRDEYNRNKTKVSSLAKLKTPRQKALKKYLQFLSIYRDGVALLSEETCRKRLAGIKTFMEAEDALAAAKQSTQQQLGNSSSLINWRDLEYGELKVKAYKFLHHLYDECRRNKAAWSKMPECAEDLKRLEPQLERLSRFYNMSRGEMAVFYESEEHYYMHWRLVLKKDVEECMDLVQRILGRVHGKKYKLVFNEYTLVPTRDKFMHRLSGCRSGIVYGKSV